MSQISINIITGNSEVDDTDRGRAETAALKVLSDAGVTVEAAYAEFQRQWAWLGTDEAIDEGRAQDASYLTGWAALWFAAEDAANVALTEGWARPDGASCGISA